MVGAVRFESKTLFSALCGKNGFKARYYWRSMRFFVSSTLSFNHLKPNF